MDVEIEYGKLRDKIEGIKYRGGNPCYLDKLEIVGDKVVAIVTIYGVNRKDLTKLSKLLREKIKKLRYRIVKKRGVKRTRYGAGLKQKIYLERIIRR